MLETKDGDALEDSAMDVGEENSLRWKRLDSARPRALQGMLKRSGSSLSQDITLKAMVLTRQRNILRGRPIIWMMINYIKTNMTPPGRIQLARH